MKILLIDNKYENLYSTEAEAFTMMLETLSDVVPEENITVIEGYEQFIDKMRFGSKGLGEEENLVAFIHDSFGMNWREAREKKEREVVSKTCEKVREVNFRSRVIIYGFASKLPLPVFVKEAKADGLMYGLMSGPVNYDALEEILHRGSVSDEEINLRGKTIEILGENKRVTGEGRWIELEIARRKGKTREGD